MKSYPIIHANGYIKVLCDEDLVLERVMKTLFRISKIEDFYKINDVWILEENITPLVYADFTIVIDTIHQHYPHVDFRKKTALVASNSLIRAISSIFTQDAQKLPYDLKVFGTLKDALKWLD